MTDATVVTIDSGPRRVTRQVVVDAPAGELFDLVADPRRHPEIDGSGTVRDIPVTGPDRLAVGARFGVGMKQFGLPYKITSTVTEFVEDALIEWRHPMGHRWRWEFQETAPGRTTVTETFDYEGSKAPRVLEIFGQPQANARGITHTLEALAARYA